MGILADLYRQEVASEEDVHRTLPFFGTALGIIIGALAYAAGRLPRWSDMPAGQAPAFIVSAFLLALAVLEAIFVLIWLSRAIARQSYQRIGLEDALRTRIAALETYYASTPDVETERPIRYLKT